MYDIKALYEARSTEEAIRLLGEHPQARPVSGGSDVLIRIREGKMAGAELVSIHGIDALRGVTLDSDGTIRIGALTSFSRLSADPVVREKIPVLALAADQVGSPQIRNIGTIGGNVCNGSPAADTPPALFALDAEIELTGPEGVRRVPIREFYIRAGVVDRKPCELLTAVLIPAAAWQGYTGWYIKYAMREALDISVVSCAVTVKLSADKKRIEDVRAAFGAVGPVPLRTPAAEAAARGREWNRETVKAFAADILREIQPWDDWRTSRVFRAHIAEEITAKALTEAVRLQDGPVPAAGGMVPAVPAPGCGRQSARESAAPVAVAGKQYKLIRCTVNGREKEAMFDVRASLADLLRNDFRLTSVKKGCEVGECGACNVLVNGVSFNSCIYLAVWADGKEILTLEGLEDPDGKISDIQQAFIDEAAVQCGFCTPGAVMSAVEILNEGRLLSDAEIRVRMSGHLCRCTGYENIVRAVRKTMRKRLGLEAEE